MELTRTLDFLAYGGPPRSPSAPQPHNAHVHLPPNFSAFANVQGAIQQAQEEGVVLLGAANYYDYSVFADFIQKATAAGIYPLLGTEILTWMPQCANKGWLVNDPGNPGKAYLCGKALARCDAPPPKAQSMLQRIRQGDQNRMATMVQALETVFSQAGYPTGLDENACQQAIANRFAVPPQTVVLQERHLAMLFQEALFHRVPEEERPQALQRILLLAEPPTALDPASVQGEIRSRLMKAGKRAFVPENFVDFDDAAQLVRDLGGVPCYPAIMDGIPGVAQFEKDPDRLMRDLKAHGVPAIEFIPTRNSPDVLMVYVRAAMRAGLVATAGTEHNTLGHQPIVPTCKNGQAVPAEASEAFWEGACVLAGHQSGVRAGEPGILQESERRSYYRGLGEAVILRTMRHL